MADPWLHIIGLTEDGLPGLSDASRLALSHAEIVFGGPRHLDLVQTDKRGMPWPVPFDPVAVLARRGLPTVVLASGDPFWFGAGGSLAAHLDPTEWTAHPAPSTFSLAAARLGWRLEETICLGLHAQLFARARPHLTNGARLICLLRDGPAVVEFAGYLTALGFGASPLTVLESVGGPLERLRHTTANAPLTDATAPVAVAIMIAGAFGLPRSSGLPDDAFTHDGQITKSPIRAITLSALAPRPGQRLWDIGAGSGSISVEWCLAGGIANAVEPRADRVSQIRANAASFGVDHRLTVTEGSAPQALADLPRPDAIFLGGGGDAKVMQSLWQSLHPGARLVANAVTLETESLLTQWHGLHGGSLMRVEIAHAAPLGRMRGWQSSRPLVQWSVTR
jgi:precorrin-6Y C5,15-methyltransferase (decarboxylating)